MLKSTEHQFYWAKKTVQRKLNLSKEDKHIISSDAELDAKINSFHSIAETSTELSKIIDQYQDRLCILSQEECIFGRFLKEVGKRSKTTGTSITNTGKAVSYCGQQRMCVRVPLIRLKHEVNVFRSQAVQDTKQTIQLMEKERTEYRAALSWMKSASCELDPDTGKGLDKFRTAQSHVREAKKNFDSISMDCIQKIDLLAAARCNMYSQALVSYMNELKQFAQKTASTFQTISNALQQKPRYDFCVLKELTQNEGDNTIEMEGIDKIVTGQDQDQTLFFADEYTDKQPEEGKSNEIANMNSTTAATEEDMLIELPQQVEDILTAFDQKSQQLNTNLWDNIFDDCSNNTKNGYSTLDATSNENNVNSSTEQRNIQQKPITNPNQNKSAWLNLFAEIDPLANPDAFNMKLNGGRNNSQQT